MPWLAGVALPDEISGPVGRTVVHQQDLEVLVRLRKYRAQRLIETIGAVVRRDYDTYQAARHGVIPLSARLRLTSSISVFLSTPQHGDRDSSSKRFHSSRSDP